LYNPGVFGNLTFGTNGPDYKVKGLELQLTALVMQGLTVQGSGSWNRSNQSNSPLLIDNNPASANFGKPITNYVFRGNLVSALNPFGEQGSPTAYSPPLQWNLRARYDWAQNDYKFFVQGGVNHTGHMYTQTRNGTDGDTVLNISTTLTRYQMDGYSSFDAATGVAKDNWTVQLFGQNLANKNASTFTSSAQFIKSEVPLRPRVLGLKFGLKF
jgi:hypothetical protein